METFSTGATRDSDTPKPDFEGFLSPLVLKEFGAYMHRHRRQADGGLRDSDNWQKGMPLPTYMKSGWRHFMDWWLWHRGQPGGEPLKDALCALIFNIQGYLHEILKAEAAPQVQKEWRRERLAEGQAQKNPLLVRVGWTEAAGNGPSNEKGIGPAEHQAILLKQHQAAQQQYREQLAAARLPEPWTGEDVACASKPGRG